MDAQVSDVGDGHRWQMEPGRTATFRILSSQTGGAAAIFEETVPPGAGTPLHIHHPSEELILVRSGSFTFRIGEEQRVVQSGGWVFVPRGLVHGWRNTGTVSGELSFIFVPAAGAVCFEELRAQERMIFDIPEAELIRTFSKYGYELVSFEW